MMDRSHSSRSFLRRLLAIACSAAILDVGLAGCVSATTAATDPTIVSLNFDDGTISQYTLAWERAIAPHGMGATFFVPSAKIGSGPDYMTWNQLSTLFAAGNDIGGHTVDHVKLTESTPTYDQKVHEVCEDRQALLRHDLDAVNFGYPEGEYDPIGKEIVRNCGYSSARASGGASAGGPVYAESSPPLDAYATRTWSVPTPPTSEIQLSDMQALVEAAATHGGGWVQIVIHRVCSKRYDPADYSDCLNAWRPMELDTLNGFLDWMADAGRSGGAPAGSVVRTMRQTLESAGTSAPTTQISCDGADCSTPSSRASVELTLAASPGSGGSPVRATHYTTDGSTPTSSSRLYTGPFHVTATSPVRFFSVDEAGHVESVKSLLILIDRIAPEVALASPADGSSFGPGTEITVSATVTNSGPGPGKSSEITGVTFYMDGTTELATVTIDPYRFSWNTESASKGTHALTAVVTDEAGNSSTSVPVSITLT